jgi:hypothetical protein
LNSIRRAFSVNVIPAVALWSLALLLWLLYTFSPPTQNVLQLLAAFKQNLGFGFSMPAQAFAAGLLPFLLQRLQVGSHRKTRARELPFLLLFWALQGALTDVFYMLQARIWGSGVTFGTVAVKAACDILGYTPFVVIPLVVTAFALKDCDYSWRRTRAFLGHDWIAQRVLPVYLSALLVWTPTVIILYALPLALQFPFQAIIQCLWGLILMVLTSSNVGEI